MRILVVEDDEVLGDGLCEGLRQDGHTIDWLLDGRIAEAALEGEAFDAVVLDLSLPGRTGIQVLKHWRDTHQTTPVVVLTAYEAQWNSVTLLDQGADDYLTKPVDLEELEARLRALARRANGHSDNRLSHCGISLDRSDRRVWVDGTPVDLSAHEFMVLEALLERPGRVVGREQLESRLYGWNEGPESNSFHVLIHKLRGHVGAHRIETVRGLGYRVTDGGAS
ncbi:response regulator [Modicisalibacter tunisiensis]|uniref:Response regulator n=1 Tax=Modicisalibacter tunisiensis TaxID=390637 RepID=A0ABS7X0G0_9GAMM|nr:response regulator [Modicisalibacter tunisiensis]MBZ9567591.1 response regulator [Modicisalibacter tunisiensis]